MPVRKTASKTVKKASLDINIDNKSNKKASKKVAKSINKLTPGAIFIALVLLVVGAVGGYFGLSLVIKNDCFELIGKDEITLIVGDRYQDDGCRVIAFGQDDSDKVMIDTNLDKTPEGEYTSDEEGTFYIVYTVDNLKYGSVFKIKKIRLITFVSEPEPEEIENANQ